MKNFVLALALLTTSSSVALAQALPAASRLGDLQAGGSFSYASSDYVPNKIRGFGFYSDFDFSSHYGVEVDFHQLTDPQTPPGASSTLYERTYEVGGRYLRHYYGRYNPYAKVLYGRGVFNFLPYCLAIGTNIPVPCNSPNVNPATTGAPANLAYNMGVLGGGVDIAIVPRINARIEYEYQRWFGFPSHGLTPQLLTIGIAYHFPAGIPHR